VRSGRDDKLEGGGPPWHGRGMDRVNQTGTPYLPRLPLTLSIQKANLDEYGSQPSPLGLNLESILIQTPKAVPFDEGQLGSLRSPNSLRPL
jgi:hypothetical protein